MGRLKFSGAKRDIPALLLFLLLFLPGLCNAQIEEVNEPSHTDFIELQREPVPLNLDSIRKEIGYPAICRDAGIEGRVIIRVLLDESGNYVKHLVLKTPHKLLSQAVEKHIAGLRCTPAISYGKAVKVWITIPFTMCALRKPKLQSSPGTAYPKWDQFILYDERPYILNMKVVQEAIVLPVDFKGKMGGVSVRVLFDASGKYIKHLILASSDALLTNAVEPHLSKLRSGPAMLKGKAVPAWLTRRFDFQPSK